MENNSRCVLQRGVANDFYFSALSIIIVASTLGLYAHDPAHSCMELRDLGSARKDGKYWIDPEKNGKPLNIYCDMTTDGGKVKDFGIM